MKRHLQKSGKGAETGKDAEAAGLRRRNADADRRADAERDQTIVEKKDCQVGEIVVTEGTDKLQDGSHVELRVPQVGERMAS